MTYTATVVTQYLLTTSVSPSAADGTISPVTGYVNAGTVSVDYDTFQRTETITIFDPNNNNAVLSTQPFANFHNGTWAIRSRRLPARMPW